MLILKDIVRPTDAKLTKNCVCNLKSTSILKSTHQYFWLTKLIKYMFKTWSTVNKIGQTLSVDEFSPPYMLGIHWNPHLVKLSSTTFCLVLKALYKQTKNSMGNRREEICSTLHLGVGKRKAQMGELSHVHILVLLFVVDL